MSCWWLWCSRKLKKTCCKDATSILKEYPKPIAIIDFEGHFLWGNECFKSLGGSATCVFAELDINMDEMIDAVGKHRIWIKECKVKGWGDGEVGIEVKHSLSGLCNNNPRFATLDLEDYYQVIAVHGSKDKYIILTFENITKFVLTEMQLVAMVENQYKIIKSLYPKHVIDAAMTCNSGHMSQELANQLSMRHSGVTICFADIVGFTNLCSQLDHSIVMNFLNNLFGMYDNLCKQFNVFKLETVGDCFVAVCGLIRENEEGEYECITTMDANFTRKSAQTMFAFTNEIAESTKAFKLPVANNAHVTLRIGIHTGDVTSGIIDCKMPRFCLFGDTMNVASRMESTCVPGCIQVSDATFRLLDDATKSSFKSTEVKVKGKGVMKTYLYRHTAAFSPSTSYNTTEDVDLNVHIESPKPMMSNFIKIARAVQVQSKLV